MLIEYIKEDKIALIDCNDTKLIDKFLLAGYKIKNDNMLNTENNINDNLKVNDIIENKPVAKKRGRSKKEAE
jgi:hypothetical protein